MKQIVSRKAVLLATAGLIVGLAGSANAGVLKTAPFRASGSDMVSCSATNVSSSMLEYMTVAIVDEAGKALALHPCPHAAPGSTCEAMVEAPKGGFCGIVFSGSSRNVRGSICILDMDGNIKAALPAQ